MSKLSTLRKQLANLRRRRQMARWATAWSALVVAAVILLGLLFALDWAFEMTRPQRIVTMAVAAIALVWTARRYTLPLLRTSETELDMALLVERQQGIDSDLVAAIQFESAEASRWGSTQLEGAVVDYVAEYGRGWDVLEGFDRRQVVRRLGALVAAVGLVLLAIVLFPHHARTFANRLALGSMHYPTDTRIDQVAVNGKPIELHAGETVVAYSAYGQPLRFAVNASDTLPPSGHLELTTLASTSRRDVQLAQSRTEGDDQAVYEAEVPQLMDSVSFQVFLGDAYTDPAEVHVIPLPTVEVTLTPTPPEYARLADANAAAPVTARQLSVLEGSKVDLSLASVNKPLTEAVLTIDDQQYQLARQDDEGKQWRLDAQTPLTRVTDQVRYEVQVTDGDGLQLQQPIVGTVRIKADRKPTIVAGMETLHVLPTATPTIDYRALDDFGIARITLDLELVRAAGPGEPNETTSLPTITVFELPESDTPNLQARHSGSYSLQLKSYDLQKDDQVRLTMAVTDFRGAAEGETVRGETLTLNVTDLGGIYAAMYELEEKAYRQTGALIDRQTQTGGSK